MCIHVCIYNYIFMHMFVCLQTYILNISIHTWVCMHISINNYTDKKEDVYIHIYSVVCLHVHIHIFIHMHVCMPECIQYLYVCTYMHM